MPHFDMVVVSKTPITRRNLPVGYRWEDDGSCWEALPTIGSSDDAWRWYPVNWRAMEKDGPTGEMTDHIPFQGRPDAAP